MPDAEASRLFDEMRSVAASFDCPLVGGDISAHDGPMVLTVTVFAEPAGVEPVLRSTARVGDAICVTGELGGSLLKTTTAGRTTSTSRPASPPPGGCARTPATGRTP